MTIDTKEFQHLMGDLIAAVQDMETSEPFDRARANLIAHIDAQLAAARAAALAEAVEACVRQNDTDWPTPLGCAKAIRTLTTQAAPTQPEKCRGCDPAERFCAVCREKERTSAPTQAAPCNECGGGSPTHYEGCSQRTNSHVIKQDERALQPCPLCGCNGIKFTSDEFNSKRHSIKCEDCPCGAEFFSSDRQQAIDAWNRRVSLAHSAQAAQDSGVQSDDAQLLDELVVAARDAATQHDNYDSNLFSRARARIIRLAASPAPSAQGAPTNEELEELWASTHYGHPADFAADVLERWGSWPAGVLGHGGSLSGGAAPAQVAQTTEPTMIVPRYATNAIAVAIEREMDSQLVASGMSPGDFHRQDGHDVWEAAIGAVERAHQASAQSEGDGA